MICSQDDLEIFLNSKQCHDDGCEPDDAEGTEEADDAAGDGDRSEGQQRHPHDEKVEAAPEVPRKPLPQVGGHVHEQLDREDGDEGEVEDVEGVRERRGVAVIVRQAGVELRLGDASGEILPQALGHKVTKE